MIKFVVSKMATKGWIFFLAMLLVNKNTLGSLSFNPGTTWYEGFGPMHASEQEKVRNQYELGRLVWQKRFLFIFLHNVTINNTASHLDITKR